MSKDSKRTETPLLRNYLNELPRFPSFMPQVPVWVQWMVFGIVMCALWPLPMHGLSIPIAICLALVIPYIVALFWKPKTAEERQEQLFYDTIAPMREQSEDGSLRRRFPDEVLLALEHIAGTRAAVLAQAHASGDATEADVTTDRCMRAALMAAAPTFKKEDQPRREWDALCANTAVVGAVVDAIRDADALMQNATTLPFERAMALKELDDLDARIEQY